MAALEAKMDKIFQRPIFPKFKAPLEGDLPYMVETCRRGPRPISLCIEKTQNFDKVLPWPKRPKLKAVEKMACPTCWILAGKVLLPISLYVEKTPILI